MTEDCILAPASIKRNPDGYCSIMRGGVTRRVHRMVYEWYNNCTIKPGNVVMHTCDTPDCMFPGHLREGTAAENRADCVAKGRHAQGDAHGARTCPEKRARGDYSGSRTHPEKLARGDGHWSRTHPEKLARGSAHGGAKLTEQDVRDIRAALVSANGTCTTLARRYGVGRDTISLISRGKTWKHVT